MKSIEALERVLEAKIKAIEELRSEYERVGSLSIQQLSISQRIGKLGEQIVVIELAIHKLKQIK